MLKNLFVFALLALLATPVSAQEKAMDIQKIETPSGIIAWLVESHSLPMVSLQVAFRAGSAFEPNNKNGVANLTAGLLTQGAGELDAQAFQKEKERLGANISASAGLLNLTAGFDALSEVTDETFALFAKALKSPTFDKADFIRLQKAVVAGRKRVPEQPRTLAQEAFAEVVYGRYHPYSRPTEGTQRSVGNLAVEDVKKYHREMFTRNNMVVSVVGDITPQALAAMLETHLGDLPKGRKRMDVETPPAEQPPVRRTIQKDIPQTTIVMGHEGLNRAAPDYFAALVTNHILGGGGFSSRLMQEVREKRGLVYGISSYFNPLPHHGAFQVVAQTKNESVDEVVDLVKQQINDMRQNGVHKDDYDAAISYLVGSFPLRLDSNSDILSYLTFMQTEELGIDYMNNWVRNIRAVSLEDVQKTAQNRFKPEDMAIVMVGKPGQAVMPAAAPEKIKQAEEVVPKPVRKAPQPEKKVLVQPEPKTEAAIQERIEETVEDTVVEEEAVAAPIQKAQEAEPVKPQTRTRTVKPKKVPQPSRPENRTRRNTDSDNWL